jgi:hypothetical protein
MTRFRCELLLPRTRTADPLDGKQTVDPLDQRDCVVGATTDTDIGAEVKMNMESDMNIDTDTPSMNKDTSTLEFCGSIYCGGITLWRQCYLELSCNYDAS